MTKKSKYYLICILFIFIIICSSINPIHTSYGDNTVEQEPSVLLEKATNDRELEKINQEEKVSSKSKQNNNNNNNNNIEKLVNTKCMWTTDRVNLRSEASTNSDKILTLDKRVKVETQNMPFLEKWTKVKYGDKDGYIFSKYLTDQNISISESNRWGIELTDEEVDLLAKILWVEARGESDLGVSAVCEVILNRMVASQFPDSLKEVLSQKSQFSSWGLRGKAQPTERELKIIHDVLRGNSDILSMDVMYFSTKPRNKHVEIEIGNHFFCREGAK